MPFSRRAPDGRIRALFLTLDAMGWATWARTVAAFTATRDDFDAVHVHYWGGGPKRLLSAPVPAGRGWLDSEARRIAVAQSLIRRWVAGPLHLGAFDVVHVAPQKYALGFVDAARATGTPLSVLLDGTVWQVKGELGGLDRGLVRRRFGPLLEAEATATSAADLVAATSRWAARSVEADFGVDAGRIIITPPVVAEAPSTPRRASSGLGSAPLRLVFVGHDWERKGGPRLLRWHQERWADAVELHVCSGRASFRTGARNTFWYGSMPNETVLRGLLPEMDVFVLPTTNDMSPWALAEAASVGIPIVSSALGAIGELVLDGTTGLLVPADDDVAFVAAIDRLLADQALRRRMGNAAFAHARRHLDASVVVNRLLDRLADLGGRRRS